MALFWWDSKKRTIGCMVEKKESKKGLGSRFWEKDQKSGRGV